jgi:hypothetical protein
MIIVKPLHCKEPNTLPQMCVVSCKFQFEHVDDYYIFRLINYYL